MCLGTRQREAMKDGSLTICIINMLDRGEGLNVTPYLFIHPPSLWAHTFIYVSLSLSLVFNLDHLFIFTLKKRKKRKKKVGTDQGNTFIYYPLREQKWASRVGHALKLCILWIEKRWGSHKFAHPIFPFLN